MGKALTPPPYGYWRNLKHKIKNAPQNLGKALTPPLQALAEFKLLFLKMASLSSAIRNIVDGYNSIVDNVVRTLDIQRGIFRNFVDTYWTDICSSSRHWCY